MEPAIVPSTLETRHARITGKVGALVFVVALANALYSMSIGLNRDLLDFYGFRQAQTAITIDYLVRGPFKLAYETPILGPPWAVPIEFPTYQYMVAGLLHIFGGDLEPTGRIVGIIMFLLCLPSIGLILRRAGVSRNGMWLGLSLVLVSPLYLFWSRTIMIESTALAFALAYLAGALCRSGRGSWWQLFIIILLGIFAAGTKVTTAAPVIFAVMVYGTRMVWIAPRAERKRILLHTCLLAALPLLAGAAWTFYTDALKHQNVFGTFLSSDAPFTRNWVYGSIAQRLNPATWSKMAFHLQDVAWPGGAILAGAVIILSLVWRGPLDRVALALVSLAFSAPVLFSNLYFVHPYYWYANGVFLLMALTVALEALRLRVRYVSDAAYAAVLILSVLAYQRESLPLQTRVNDGSKINAGRIVAVAGEQDVVVYGGLGWSCDLPYCTGRRSLLIQNWPGVDAQTVNRAFAEMKREGYGSTVLVVSAKSGVNVEALRARMTEAGVAPHAVVMVE